MIQQLFLKIYHNQKNQSSTLGKVNLLHYRKVFNGWIKKKLDTVLKIMKEVIFSLNAKRCLNCINTKNYQYILQKMLSNIISIALIFSVIISCQGQTRQSPNLYRKDLIKNSSKNIQNFISIQTTQKPSKIQKSAKPVSKPALPPSPPIKQQSTLPLIQQLIISSQPKSEILQEKAPTGAIHSFRISPVYTQQLSNSKKFAKISTIFGIAAMYFNKVIKVRYLDQSQVRLNQIFEGCEAIPISYTKKGFDQNHTDTLVTLTKIPNPTTPSNSNATYQSWTIAKMTPCGFSRRVTYGVLSFNTSAIGSSYLALHNTAQVTIHELTHLLGFSHGLYTRFFESPHSPYFKPHQQVIQNHNNHSYIITPQVRQYVRTYFNCQDNTGGLLANQQQPAHWDKDVYQNQLMTPTVGLSGLRISGLTLALLFDTGYYEEVDIGGFAEEMKWGRNRGCGFAQGKVVEMCVEDVNTCDYENRFTQRGCNNMFDNHVQGEICEDFAEGVGSEFHEGVQKRDRTIPSEKNKWKRYGFMSRCFRVGDGTSCYKASCDGNRRGIRVWVGGAVGKCTSPNQRIVVNKVEVTCPSNFEVFCNYRGCYNYCRGRGVCVNSRCMCVAPYKGVDCGLM